MTTKKKLTGKQDLFCREYIIDHNAVQAAIRAGYSKKTAHQIGPENLRKPSIKERLEQLTKPKIDKLEITAERVLREIALIAFSNIQDLFDEDDCLKPISQLTRDQAAILSSVEIDEIIIGKGEEKKPWGKAKKMKLWDKLKAQNMLASHLALLQSDPMAGDDGDVDESFL